MSKHGILVIGVLVVLFSLTGNLEADQNWPSFRGSGAMGIAEGHPLPVEWDLDSGKNVKWLTPIPGLGLSSPAIWGDRVFVTTAVKDEGDDV